MRAQDFTAVLETKVRLAKNVLKIRLRLNGSNQFQFRSGQHIVLRIPIGDSFADRPFSIASSPHDTRFLELLVKLTSDGVAPKYLDRAEPGSRILFYGPKGSFRVKSLGARIFFIASGTGIAPLRSMIYDLLEVKKVRTKICCFLFVRKDELFMDDELGVLGKTHDNFDSWIIFRDARTDTSIPSRFISKLNKLSINRADDFYICGSSHFIQEMQKILSRKKIPLHRIHSE